MTDIELALVHYDGNGDMPYCDLVWKALRLLQKQEKGLVLALPVEIGGPVYAVECVVLGDWNEGTRARYGVVEYSKNTHRGGLRYEQIPKIGKTVFATRAEAEKALKEAHHD